MGVEAPSWKVGEDRRVIKSWDHVEDRIFDRVVLDKLRAEFAGQFDYEERVAPVTVHDERPVTQVFIRSAPFRVEIHRKRGWYELTIFQSTRKVHHSAVYRSSAPGDLAAKLGAFFRHQGDLIEAEQTIERVWSEVTRAAYHS